MEAYQNQKLNKESLKVKLKNREKKRLRGSVPKPETEQASGSAEQPRYKQPSEDDFWNNRTVK